MKMKSVLTSVAIAGLMTGSSVALSAIVPTVEMAVAAELNLSTDKKIELLTQYKGQFGSGDQMRRFFFEDMTPIGIQPGGAGMVVNLYSAKEDVTISYCTSYDVVVAVRKGRVTRFADNEVK